MHGRARIPIKTYEPGPAAGEPVFAVFIPNGTFVGEQPVAPAVARFVKGDRLYALVEKRQRIPETRDFQNPLVLEIISGPLGAGYFWALLSVMVRVRSEFQRTIRAML